MFTDAGAETAETSQSRPIRNGGSKKLGSPRPRARPDNPAALGARPAVCGRPTVGAGDPATVLRHRLAPATRQANMAAIRRFFGPKRRSWHHPAATVLRHPSAAPCARSRNAAQFGCPRARRFGALSGRHRAVFRWQVTARNVRGRALAAAERQPGAAAPCRSGGRKRASWPQRPRAFCGTDPRASDGCAGRITGKVCQ